VTFASNQAKHIKYQVRAMHDIAMVGRLCVRL